MQLFLLYFSQLGVLLLFIRDLGATQLVLLFHAIIFFFLFILCEIIVAIIIFAMSFAEFNLVLQCLQWQTTASLRLGIFFLSVSTISLWCVYVSFSESLDRVSAVTESCLDLYSSCKPHNCVKTSLCNLGDENSKFFLAAVTSGFVSDSF